MKKKHKKQAESKPLDLGIRAEVFLLLNSVANEIFRDVANIMAEDSFSQESNDALIEVHEDWTRFLSDIFINCEDEELQSSSRLSPEALGEKLRSMFAIELYCIYGNSEELAREGRLALISVLGIFVQKTINALIESVQNEQSEDEEAIMQSAMLQISKLCVKWSEILSNDSSELPAELVNSLLSGEDPKKEFFSEVDREL